MIKLLKYNKINKLITKKLFNNFLYLKSKQLILLYF
jgi:hypothetical protein